MGSGKVVKGCQPSRTLTRVNACNGLSCDLKQEVIRGTAIATAGLFTGPLQGNLLRSFILFFPLQMDFLAQEPVARMAKGGRAGAAKSEFPLRPCNHKTQSIQHHQ